MSNCEANEEAFPDGTLVVPITVLGNQNPAVDTELRRVESPKAEGEP